MSRLIFFIFFALFTANLEAKDPLEEFLSKNVNIGYGHDNMLMVRSNYRHEKVPYFAKGEGRRLQILKTNDGMYQLKIGTSYLSKSVRSMGNSFVKLSYSRRDQFWIRLQSDGFFALGYEGCPLFFKGSVIFKCNKTITDTFWIKKDFCRAEEIQINSNSSIRFDGFEVVGIETATSCSVGTNHKISLKSTQNVDVEVKMQIRVPYGSELSLKNQVQLKDDASILGRFDKPPILTIFLSSKSSETLLYKMSKSRVTSAKNSEITVTYDTPGGASILGLVKRYRFNETHVQGRIPVSCTSGRRYMYEVTLSLQVKNYGRLFYQSTSEMNCLLDKGFYNPSQVENYWTKCFPN